MTKHATPLFDQRDAWVLSTYQRLERIAAPAFGSVVAMAPDDAVERAVVPVQLRMLPADLPREVSSFAAWAEGHVVPAIAPLSAWQRISLLLRYLAAPLRYEPDSENILHKAVPSSRARFPLDYILLEPCGREVRAWLYVPELHALREVACMAGRPMPGPARLGIACVGRVWTYARDYGEFSHFPCMLEAGHAWATLAHLTGMLGLTPLHAPEREAVHALCDAQLDCAMWAATLTSQAVCAQLPQRMARLALARPRAGLTLPFPRWAALQRVCASGPFLPVGPAPAGACEAQTAWPAIGALATMRRRSSGNAMGGLSALLATPAAGLFTSLLAGWRALACRRATRLPEPSLHCTLAWLAARGDTRPGLYRQSGGAIDTGLAAPQLAAALAAMLPSPETRVNPAALTAILLIQCAVPDAICRFGDAALREVHLAAGAIAQDFSFAAAAHGMFARPVRMMREARLEAALPLQGQVVYMVLCGFARASNLTMELS